MLDQNNDNEINLNEMIEFVSNRLHKVDDLIIAVYWIGFNLKPKDFKLFPKLKERFVKHHHIRPFKKSKSFLDDGSFTDVQE